MKRPLDLLWPSSLLVQTIALLLVVLPAALTALAFGLEALGVGPIPFFGTLTLWSVVLGGIVFGVFLLLIAIEQAQDRLFDAWYRRQRGRPVSLGNGHYECQFCGNRQVREGDRSCGVCGRRLSPCRRPTTGGP